MHTLVKLQTTARAKIPLVVSGVAKVKSLLPCLHMECQATPGGGIACSESQRGERRGCHFFARRESCVKLGARSPEAPLCGHTQQLSAPSKSLQHADACSQRPQMEL